MLFSIISLQFIKEKKQPRSSLRAKLESVLNEERIARAAIVGELNKERSEHIREMRLANCYSSDRMSFYLHLSLSL